METKPSLTEKTENEVIAEFMGILFDTSGQCTAPERMYSWRPGCLDPLRVEHLQYHNNWSWLMPVVEKISQIRCAPDSEFDHDTFYPRTFGMLSPEARKPMVRINRCQVFESDTLINATYQSVVDFITGYNNQKK